MFGIPSEALYPICVILILLFGFECFMIGVFVGRSSDDKESKEVK